MNATRRMILLAGFNIAWEMAVRAALVLQCQPAGENLLVIWNSQPQTNYQFQISTDLTNWTDLGATVTGDGLSKTQTVSTVEPPMAFFRVRASQASAGLAPADAEFTALVSGKMLFQYVFLSATRFSWSGEPGNWDYAKTSDNAGKLVLTYDEDGNNAAVYREEIVLTFQTPTQGTYRYSEFPFGVEDPASITTGDFNLGGP